MTEHFSRDAEGLLVSHTLRLAFEHTIYCRIMAKPVGGLPDLPRLRHRRPQFIVISTKMDGKLSLFFDYSRYPFRQIRRRAEMDFLPVLAVRDAFALDRVPCRASDEAGVRNAKPAFILQFSGNARLALQPLDDGTRVGIGTGVFFIYAKCFVVPYFL